SAELAGCTPAGAFANTISSGVSTLEIGVPSAARTVICTAALPAWKPGSGVATDVGVTRIGAPLDSVDAAPCTGSSAAGPAPAPAADPATEPGASWWMTAPAEPAGPVGAVSTGAAGAGASTVHEADRVVLPTEFVATTVSVWPPTAR